MKQIPKNYKWTWTIDQRSILESGLNIDIIDFSILRMLMDFATCEACRKMHQEGLIFYMFSWKLVTEQMPILNLNTRQSVKKRFAKLIVAKLIIPHPDNKKTRTAWFKFGENRGLLFSKHCKPKLSASNESLQHCKPKLSVTSNESLQPTSNESLQDTTTNINTTTINKDNNTTQSEIGDAQKQNVSLNSKIKQLEEQNKKLAERLTKQSVKQNTKDQPAKKKKGLPYLEEYQKVVGWINEICQRRLVIYKDPKAIQQDEKYKVIIARIRKGATLEQMQAVIRLKNKQWKDDKKMRDFRRPSTLFGGHWSKYLDELSDQVTDTPIQDTYDKLNKYIKDNQMTAQDVFEMSNNLGKYRKTQP